LVVLAIAFLLRNYAVTEKSKDCTRVLRILFTQLKKQGEIDGLPLRKLADCTTGFEVPLQNGIIIFQIFLKILKK
jgi:hypothetical protein